MAYKCEIFDAVNLTFHGHYMHVCTVSKVIGIDTENKICLPSREDMCSLIINNKYGCQVHVTYVYYC